MFSNCVFILRVSVTRSGRTGASSGARSGANWIDPTGTEVSSRDEAGVPCALYTLEFEGITMEFEGVTVFSEVQI